MAATSACRVTIAVMRDLVLIDSSRSSSAADHVRHWILTRFADAFERPMQWPIIRLSIFPQRFHTPPDTVARSFDCPTESFVRSARAASQIAPDAFEPELRSRCTPRWPIRHGWFRLSAVCARPILTPELRSRHVATGIRTFAGPNHRRLYGRQST